MTAPTATAAELDAADPLAGFVDRFAPAPGLAAYLDGNSLGRPLRTTAGDLRAFVERPWGERLIRSWDEVWMEEPFAVGDAIGAHCLGAAPGQTVVADSTSVCLYKLVRAALALQLPAGRNEIVVDRENFPTDRYLVEGVAAECGARLVWLEPDPAAGVEAAQLAAVAGERTAVVLLSHVAYRSGYLADGAALTAAAHDVGALMLWDLSHSVGSVPLALDAWEADLAAGCSYKYLNGGPGAPAFAYVAARHHDVFRQPIQGWMGHAEPFVMGQGYAPAPGLRRFLSGTPPILAMQPMKGMLSLIAEAGMPGIRAKSLALTARCIEIAGALDGVTVAGPADPERRGSHVTLEHPAAGEAVARLWEEGVIPDFRAPRTLRIGLSPLSTSFTELDTAMAAIGRALS